MNTNRIRILTMGIIFSCLIMPLTGFAHEPVDPLHAVPIETVHSNLADPTEIHVQITDKSVEITGILKRDISHKRQGLHGYVDVELLDAGGQVIEMVTIPIKSQPGPAKHDHERKFSATLSLPPTGDFAVRVQHHIGTKEYQQTE